MKAFTLPLAISVVCLLSSHLSEGQLIKKIKDKVAHKTEEKAEEKSDKPKEKEPQEESTDNQSSTPNEQKSEESTESSSSSSSSETKAPPTLKAYQNYDFIPGNKVLFEDNFMEDQDGEFPTHWELISGQAVLNKVDDQLGLFFTDGNYARVKPRMKTENYLTDPFTIEYDWYFIPGAYGVVTMLRFNDKKEGYLKEAQVNVSNSEVNFGGTQISLSKSLQEDLKENFDNKWHHVAIAFKNNQMKVYVDQYRTLVVPDTKESYEFVEFASIGDEKTAPVIKNVRIASGGSMNLIGKKFTDAKIVTHGITFDYNKSNIKPESMGTLNMIKKVMDENPDLKFEVDGYTDADGDDADNMKLSKQRADAVRSRLVEMGVDGGRLTTKGFGETKPISDNNTIEGKANNRRVEFVKM
jgi:OOP family OmpA-OmpF porin